MPGPRGELAVRMEHAYRLEAIATDQARFENGIEGDGLGDEGVLVHGSSLGK